MRRRTLILLVGWVLASIADVLHAQGVGPRANPGIPRYQPQSPTLSPYLNLLRPQGALPNYYALVRPIQRQEAFNQQSLAFQRRQTLGFERLEREFAQPEILPTGTAGWFFDEGRQAPYGNTSHYYQQLEAESGLRPSR
jgi:hypothetical protein